MNMYFKECRRGEGLEDGDMKINGKKIKKIKGLV